MSLAKTTRAVSIRRLDGAAVTARDDALAVEEPLEIRVGGRSVAVVMRTPGHDRELAAGFLATEGIVRRREDVLDIVYCAMGPAAHAAGDAARENILDVLLAPGVVVDWARLTRNVFTSSSCGLCSKASIEAVRAQFPPLGESFSPRRAVLAALPEKLRAAQAAFAATGGLHASGLFDAAGTLEVAREDVGRHNALDKIIGQALLAGRLPLAGRLVLMSGRVSFEIMQKALVAGIPCVAAISAPTSAAVEFARASGQTLVGFLRSERMNVYAGTLAG
ncbi:MAG: formate dehydrogenase accessory sulfurtransferase FdhD [Opitutus sp.]|nr:formate dehydrogenase accessory sulfurtransferase FdhD [Opitutus sp.]